MTPALGKRKRTSRHELKRDHEDVDSTSSSGSDTGTQEIFRRHFESKFKPLERNGKSVNFSDKQAPASLDAQEENVEHDWSGFSSQAESDEGPMVVNQANFPASAAPRGVKSKSFMHAKPPSDYAGRTKPQSSKPQKAEDDGDEVKNLKNDLALQRLISESHILDNKKDPATENRQRVMDVRLRSLGAPKSILEQQKMPMSHRRGMMAKAKDKDDRRRQEARENGVILARITKPKKDDRRRERGIGGPSIGKFTGGTLSLSKRDVAFVRGQKQRG